ncbi:MAG: hypothetical protein NVSMB53_15510 [Gemmatimonadaceae bacterium]
MLEHRLDGSRAPIAPGDHLVKLAASGGYEGELGGDEKSVHRDQSKYSNHATRRHGHRRRIGGLCSNKSKDHMPLIYSNHIVVETYVPAEASN